LKITTNQDFTDSRIVRDPIKTIFRYQIDKREKTEDGIRTKVVRSESSFEKEVAESRWIDGRKFQQSKTKKT
jgi:hypothetical protein